MNNILAFPLPEYTQFVRNKSAEGMDLRDFFASAALQGLLSNAPTDMILPENVMYAFAKSAYLLADAMIFVRELDIHKPETVHDL